MMIKLFVVYSEVIIPTDPGRGTVAGIGVGSVDKTINKAINKTVDKTIIKTINKTNNKIINKTINKPIINTMN